MKAVIKGVAWLAVLMSMLAGSVWAGDNDWESRKRDKRRGIHAFVRQEEGNRMLSFKVTAEIPTQRPESVAAVMFDIPNYCDWVYLCKEIKILKKVSETEYYIYMVHNAPYPLHDRDTVLHGWVEKDKKTGALLIYTKAVPDYMPPVPGYVRMVAEEMLWRFDVNEKGTGMSLVLTGYADPGGVIPAWAVNFVQVDAPFYSIRKLMRQVDKPDYANAALPPAIQSLVNWAEKANNYTPPAAGEERKSEKDKSSEKDE